MTSRERCEALMEYIVEANQGYFDKEKIGNDLTAILIDLGKKEKQDEILNIFKSIVKRKDAIITCPCIKEGRMKTNIIITLDALNDKDILCNETIKEWLEDDK